MFLYLPQGILLGFSAGISPGPMLAYFLSQSLAKGWRQTLPAAFAPLLSDGPIVAVVLILLSRSGERILLFLQLVGGCFVLYLAWRAYETFRDPPDPDQIASGEAGSLGKAVLLNMLNPNPYIFWGTVMGPTVLTAWAESRALALSYILGFYITLILIFMGFIGLFSSLRGRGKRVIGNLNGISALALLIFGASQIYAGIQGLIT